MHRIRVALDQLTTTDRQETAEMMLHFPVLAVDDHLLASRRCFVSSSS
jgi:hypothetical protein